MAMKCFHYFKSSKTGKLGDQIEVKLGIRENEMLIVMLLFMYYVRSIVRTNWLAIAGLVFLMIIVVISATSFHHMDILLTPIFWDLKLIGFWSCRAS